MKVAGVKPLSRDKLLGPAGIVIISCVERLTQIADEVQKELQRQQPLGGSGARIGEFGRELIDLIHYASPWRPFRGRDPGRRGGCPKQAEARFGLIR